MAAQVDDRAAALGCDHCLSGIELFATVTPARAERLTGQALGMQPHQGRSRFGIVDVTENEHHMNLTRALVAVGVRDELRVAGGDPGGRHAGRTSKRRRLRKHAGTFLVGKWLEVQPWRRRVDSAIRPSSMLLCGRGCGAGRSAR